jgi:hypothetical protein
MYSKLQHAHCINDYMRYVITCFKVALACSLLAGWRLPLLLVKDRSAPACVTRDTIFQTEPVSQRARGISSCSRTKQLSFLISVSSVHQLHCKYGQIEKQAQAHAVLPAGTDRDM